MKVLATLLALWMATSGPVASYAATTAQKAASGASGCAGLMCLTFTTNRYVLKGRVYNNIQSVPGFTGSRASQETQTWADGHLSYCASGVPCVSDLGFNSTWPSSTNIVPYSNVTTNWTAAAASLTSGQADPLGGTGATLFTADGTSAVHSTTAPGASFVGLTVYTASMYVHAGTSSRVQLTLSGFVFLADGYANFLLSGAGSISASGGVATAGIQQLAGGWYRIWIVETATYTLSGYGLSAVALNTGSESRSPTITNSGTFYTFGAQIEAQTVPTPYIPTPTSSTATRAADVWSIAYGPPNGSSATLIYGTNSTASPSPTSPIYLGSTSGGAWIGSSIRSLVVKK